MKSNQEPSQSPVKEPVSETPGSQQDLPAVFVVLLHSPMKNRVGQEVTTAVTNLDIHDIARSCKTFGVRQYFIVNPEEEQETMVQGILSHWHSEVSQIYHPARAAALETVCYLRTFEEAYNEATRLAHGARPFVVMPDAKRLPDALSYDELRRRWMNSNLTAEHEPKKSHMSEGFPEKRSLMIVFGTGWGIAPRFYDRVDAPLEPIRGPLQYNHLSVRAAAAIVLDRLFRVE